MGFAGPALSTACPSRLIPVSPWYLSLGTGEEGVFQGLFSCVFLFVFPLSSLFPVGIGHASKNGIKKMKMRVCSSVGRVVAWGCGLEAWGSRVVVCRLVVSVAPACGAMFGLGSHHTGRLGATPVAGRYCTSIRREAVEARIVAMPAVRKQGGESLGLGLASVMQAAQGKNRLPLRRTWRGLKREGPWRG